MDSTQNNEFDPAQAASSCRRESFLEDPMTTEYGVGAEMVDLVACSCRECMTSSSP